MRKFELTREELIEFAKMATFHLDDRLCPFSREALRAEAWLMGYQFAKRHQQQPEEVAVQAMPEFKPKQECSGDLEKEIAFFAINAGTGDNTPTIGEIAHHFVEWQKKHESEWSEEDEKMLRYAADFISTSPHPYAGDTLRGEKGKDEIINWVKSLKERVQPQNTWKPSDEQMKALHAKLSYVNGDRELVPDVILESLYNDLKKLRGE